MQVTCWGVRGSHPAPGADTLEYGGNTPCIEIQAGESRVIIDAGTGICALGRQLGDEPAHHHLLFTHVHWDHIQGLPFFAPLHHPTTRMTIHAGHRSLALLQDLLTYRARDIQLPIPPQLVQADIEFRPFSAGESWRIGEIDINTVMLNHPYNSVGFRCRAGGRTAVICTDTAPFSGILFGYEYRPRPPLPDETPDPYEQGRLLEMRRAVIEQSNSTDLLIYDAHFTLEEYPRFAHFGHSTPYHALQIAQESQAKRLVLFHHAPGRSDAALAEIENRYGPRAARLGIELSAAREGERITL